MSSFHLAGVRCSQWNPLNFNIECWSSSWVIDSYSVRLLVCCIMLYCMAPGPGTNDGSCVCWSSSWIIDLAVDLSGLNPCGLLLEARDLTWSQNSLNWICSVQKKKGEENPPKRGGHWGAIEVIGSLTVWPWAHWSYWIIDSGHKLHPWWCWDDIHDAKASRKEIIR